MPTGLAHRLLKTPRRLWHSARSRFRAPDRFLRSCSRIVHVGANTGQERERYNEYGLEVVWIEPIPAIYEQLVRNIRPYPRQTAIQALLTDRAGSTVKLNIANNGGASSSIFELALHKDIWPHVDFVDHILLRTETLDGLLAARFIDQPPDAIILDTQGSELLILKGASSVLQHVRYIKVEAADFESYTGGATVDEIASFLGTFSFHLTQKNQFAKHPAGGGYYDLLFRSGAWRLRRHRRATVKWQAGR